MIKFISKVMKDYSTINKNKLTDEDRSELAAIMAKTLLHTPEIAKKIFDGNYYEFKFQFKLIGLLRMDIMYDDAPTLTKIEEEN